MDAITRHPKCRISHYLASDCRISHYLAFELWKSAIPTFESAVRAPHERGRIIHRKSTYFLHLLQCFDASHELEGVMARIVSTEIASEGTSLNRDIRSMVDQSKVGIARPAVDGALVQEYEDMLMGTSSKLSRSQCLRLGRKETPMVRRLPAGRVPQIHSIGGVEGQHVIPTGGPSVCLLPTSISGTAVVELTSPRFDSPPRCVGNRNSPSNDDGADVVDSRTEGIPVNDLEAACSRVCFESTEVLMHILSIAESVLQSESNRLCSHKARGRVDIDCLQNLVPAVDVSSMGSFEIVVDRGEVLEHWHVEVMLVDIRIRRQEPVVDRIRVEWVACGRTAGLELLPFIDKNISSKGDFSAPIPAILVSAFERGHEILQSTQTSSQISGVFERKNIEVRFIRRMETGNSSNFSCRSRSI